MDRQRVEFEDEVHQVMFELNRRMVRLARDVDVEGLEEGIGEGILSLLTTGVAKRFSSLCLISSL